MQGIREEPSDPRTYLRQIWRRRWVLLGIVVLIPVAVYLVSSWLPKTYEASATLSALSPSGAERTAELLQTRGFAQDAARRLGDGPGSARDLLDDITVGPTDGEAAPAEETGPQLFSVTARAGSAQRAAEIANAFAGVQIARRRAAARENIERAIASVGTAEAGADADGAGSDVPELSGPLAQQQLEKEQGKFLAQQLRRLQALQASEADSPLVERAVAPDGPVSPRPLTNTAVALVFSILLAGGVALVLNAFDRRLRDPRSLEALVGAPLLSTVPERAFSEPLPPPTPIEAFQTLRANLTYLNPDRALRSVILVSPGENEGNTTVAINLAIAFAETDHDVVLIDADLRRSPIAARLGLEPRYGLEDVLVHGKDLDAALGEAEVDTESGRLRVLSGGAPPANPSALLSSRQMNALLDEVSSRSGVVVIDTPPLLAVSDAIPLLAQVSGAVLVARRDRTRRDDVLRTRELIANAHGTVLGAVLTGSAPDPFESGAYGYGGEGAETEPAATADGEPRPRPAGVLQRIRTRLSGAGR